MRVRLLAPMYSDGNALRVGMYNFVPAADTPTGALEYVDKNGAPKTVDVVLGPNMLRRLTEDGQVGPHIAFNLILTKKEKNFIDAALALPLGHPWRHTIKSILNPLSYGTFEVHDEA